MSTLRDLCNELTDKQNTDYKERYEKLRKTVDNVIDNLELYVGRDDKYIPTHSQLLFVATEAYTKLRTARQ